MTVERPAARLLIVDDVEENREVLVRRFSRLGFECLAAGDGPSALEIIAASPVDVVLLDIVMPGMNGLEVLRLLRRIRSPGELPVIMVSANDEADDAVQALALGANDYLTKPVNWAVARARVESQLSRKRAEDELQAAIVELRETTERAEAANRAKSEFLANMSHEIRTPLNGVMAIASTLADVCTTDHQREMVGIIADSAVLLERLVSDVLDLARIETGKLEIREETFDLGDAVARSAAVFERSAEAKGLALSVEVDASARGAVRGDPLRVRQILNNLLSNAVKFTAVGSVTCVVARDATGACRFEIRDTGIGFGPEVAQKLFNRFEQADGSITRRFGGSGLGLAICRELAELMGGAIAASAQEGRGAVFTVTLPLPAETARTAAGGQQPDLLELCAMTQVLLADDHPTNRRIVELILGAVGVDVHCVENGEDAVRAFEVGRFDAILMDMQMPVMDGLSAIRLIREAEARRQVARTPVITLSANGLGEHLELSRAAGADRHLTKPIVAQTLLSTLAELTSGPLAVEDTTAASASGG